MRVLILPSPLGQGDLMIARELAVALAPDFEVVTGCYSHNREASLWPEIPGLRLMLSDEVYPYADQSYGARALRLAREIAAARADVVVPLNEIVFVLAAFAAGIPSVQVAHVLNREILEAGEQVIEGALFAGCDWRRELKCALSDGDFSFLDRLNPPGAGAAGASSRSNLLSRVAGPAKAVLKRVLGPALQRRFRNLNLIDRYPYYVAAAYLAFLLGDRLVFHSLFPLPQPMLDRLNGERLALGRATVTAANSIAPAVARNPGRDPEPLRREISERHFDGAPLRRLILVTLGGYDHPVTDGLVRFVRALAAATGSAAECHQVLLAGKVVETRRSLFEQEFRGTEALRRGNIRFAGLLDHDAHLKALAAADLVIMQPGYSAFCESVAAGKPVVLVYGFFGYYEQYANFTGAAESGLCLTPSPGRPWMQTGAYYLFGSPGPVSQRDLNRSLTRVLQFENSALQSLREKQRGAFERFPVDAIAAACQCCRELAARPRPPIARTSTPALAADSPSVI